MIPFLVGLQIRGPPPPPPPPPSSNSRQKFDAAVSDVVLDANWRSFSSVKRFEATNQIQSLRTFLLRRCRTHKLPSLHLEHVADPFPPFPPSYSFWSPREIIPFHRLLIGAGRDKANASLVVMPTAGPLPGSDGLHFRSTDSDRR